MSVLGNFDGWKNFLGDRVKQAKAIGLNDDTIAKLAYEIGDFLGEKVDPKNAPERTLKELWDVGTESERQTIAKLMVKLVEKG